MPQPHTTNGHASNPEVRFERTDIDLAVVVRYGLGFAVLVAASLTIVVGLFTFLLKTESASKKTILPPAEVDRGMGRLPPEPRLEAMDDLQKKDPQLMPERARKYLESQERELEQGNAEQGVLPIENAIAAVAGRLPSRKGPSATPPGSFTIRLPSKAASGRESTGGQ